MKQGFDNRIVSYEHIHSIDLRDTQALVRMVAAKPGDVVLDAMCGYGAVARVVLQTNPTAQLWCLDESGVQLARARDELLELSPDRFVLGSMPDQVFPAGMFDAVVMKMGLHEVPKNTQPYVAREVSRILKPGAKWVVWDVMLDETTQLLFQDIIREKDRLAGYDMLVEERYFFTEVEFVEMAQQVGFAVAGPVHQVAYRFSSKKRLGPELRGDSRLLEQLNVYIRRRFSPELRRLLRFWERDGDIRFDVPKRIYQLQK